MKPHRIKSLRNDVHFKLSAFELPEPTKEPASGCMRAENLTDPLSDEQLHELLDSLDEDFTERQCERIGQEHRGNVRDYIRTCQRLADAAPGLRFLLTDESEVCGFERQTKAGPPTPTIFVQVETPDPRAPYGAHILYQGPARGLATWANGFMAALDIADEWRGEGE